MNLLFRGTFGRALFTLFIFMGVLVLQPFGLGNVTNAATETSSVYLPNQNYTYTCGTNTCRLNTSQRYDAGAMWAGDGAYILGGVHRHYGTGNLNGRYSQIVKYVPGGAATPREARLSRGTSPDRGISNAAVVWDPRSGDKECLTGCGYILGGWGSGLDFSKDIYRFDPSAQDSSLTAVTYAGALPYALWGAAGVFDGTNIYLFGGDKGVGNWTDAILRYSPITKQVNRMASSLPSLMTDADAVWATHLGGCELGCIYVIGGRRWYSPNTHPNPPILRYVPLLDGLPGAITVMGTTLPRWRTDSVWDGRYIYLFGGLSVGGWGQKAWDTIYRYDPILDQLDLIDRFPRAHWGAPAVCANDVVHLFGGSYELVSQRQNEPPPDDWSYQRQESDSDFYFTSNIVHWQLPESIPDEILGWLLSILIPQFDPLVPDDVMQIVLNLVPPCRDWLGNLVFRVFERVQDGQTVVEREVARVEEEATQRINDVYQILMSVDPCSSAKYRVEIESSNQEVIGRTAWVAPPLDLTVACLD